MSQFSLLFVTLLLTVSSTYAAFNPSIIKPRVDKSVTQNQAGAIDINHASAKELMSLKGIGEKRAQAIIAYRQEHGLFKSVNELSSVKGFTEKKLASLLKSNEAKIVAKANV